MKLIDISTQEEIQLPNDLLWEDELKWSPVVGKLDYSLTGAMVVQTGVKKAGRPITLRNPDDSMAWVTRDTVEKLRSWQLPAARIMKLVLEYPGDSREFKVAYRHHEGPIEAEQVIGFPNPHSEEWFKVKIKLMEIL